MVRRTRKNRSCKRMRGSGSPDINYERLGYEEAASVVKSKKITKSK